MGTQRPRRSLGTSEIATLLEGVTTPGRIASLSPNGFPLISTVWLLYREGSFWAITQARTRLRRNLAANPRCAFDIALEQQRFKLLRGQGVATLDLEDGARVTNLMIGRYLGDPDGPIADKLRAQIPTEYAICIEPQWVRGQGRP